jgi:hypothetical protein
VDREGIHTEEARIRARVAHWTNTAAAVRNSPGCVEQRPLRHSDVAILSYEEIGERRFANWSMGRVNLEHVNTSLLLKYSESATLDPYGVSGMASMALLHELMVRASIMGQTNLSPSAAR